MPKRNRRSLGEMQVDANNYAREYFRKVDLRIPEGHMDVQAPIIMAALVQAWAAGYAARDEEKAR